MMSNDNLIHERSASVKIFEIEENKIGSSGFVVQRNRDKFL